MEDSQIKQYVKTRSPFNHSTVMFKKEDILSVGGYSSLMRFIQDYYLWIKLVNAKFYMKNIPEILLNFRVDSNMFLRRSGYKYFKSSKEISKQMLKMGIINYPYYLFNIIVRFIVQVLMSNRLRILFYKKVLRR